MKWYQTLGIAATAIATFFTAGKAIAQNIQEKNQKAKYSNEIIREGDNIIVPQERLEEFFKNYKPEKKSLKKTTAESLEGTLTSSLDQTPLPGRKITLKLYDPINGTYLGTTNPIWTDINGFYFLDNITDINDEIIPKNYKIDMPYPNPFNPTTTITVPVPKQGKYKLTLTNIAGEEIAIFDEELNTGIHTFTIKEPGAAGIYIYGFKGSQGLLSTGKIVYLGGGTKSFNIISHKDEKNIPPELAKNLNENNKLGKITEIGATISIADSMNEYHNYTNGPLGNWSGQRTLDLSLIPRTNLENIIIDPTYTGIDTIKTLRDLWWYVARVTDEWDNKEHGDRLWPIVLYLDSSKAPAGAIEEARNVIQYFRDSLDIHPDSLIRETPIMIDPSSQNGFSAAKMIWTDSMEINNQNSSIAFILSGTTGKFIGAKIYIDTNKVKNNIDIGKYLSLQLQKYITGGTKPINDPEYLAYTTNTFIGPRNRPNNDEKKYIKTGRFTKPFYINRVYP